MTRPSPDPMEEPIGTGPHGSPTAPPCIACGGTAWHTHRPTPDAREDRDPLDAQWGRLDEAPAASAQMIAWHAPKTAAALAGDTTEAEPCAHHGCSARKCGNCHTCGHPVAAEAGAEVTIPGCCVDIDGDRWHEPGACPSQRRRPIPDARDEALRRDFPGWVPDAREDRDGLRERLREAMLQHWWATQTGPDADRWEELDAEDRENVAENSYADIFLAAVLAVVRSEPGQVSAETLDGTTRLLCEQHRLIGGRCRCGFDPRLDAFAMARHQAHALADAGLLAVTDTTDGGVAVLNHADPEIMRDGRLRRELERERAEHPERFADGGEPRA